MKLLTLNTHSHAENDYQRKLEIFVDAISEEMPDIIALQEVNQTSSEMVTDKLTRFYTKCMDDVCIRIDNHVLSVTDALNRRGIDYFWTWLPIKRGYGRFDEGIAIMSRSEILETDILTVSDVDDINNWRTRKLLGIRTAARPDTWFYSVHFGWWDDKEEPFVHQWQKASQHMRKYERVWLMGDLNNAADVRGEGYDLIISDGWYDSYAIAIEKDDGITVAKSIDGWRDKKHDGMRIDHIICRQNEQVLSSYVIFNGSNREIVSDHYGVAVICKEGESK